MIEPDGHSGDPAADPAALDPDHRPDRDYRELDTPRLFRPIMWRLRRWRIRHG